MVIPIIYPSALQFWLNARNQRDVQRLQETRILSTITANSRLTHDSALLQRAMDRIHVDPPMMLFSPTAGTRMSNQLVSCKTLSAHLPTNSFYVLEEWEDPSENESCFVMIASPELCFLQAAAEMSLPQLILLGFQMCARFIADTYSPTGQSAITPITSVAALKSYLTRVKRVKGIQNARRAVRFILDNSNSPMETLLGMMAVLPYFLGGYKLPRPYLNLEVALSREGANVFGRPTCSCDLTWTIEKVIIEYDSNLTHLSVNQHAQDKKKSTALSLSGYQLINATASQLKDLWMTDQFFNSVRTALHIRSNKERLDKTVDIRRKLFLQLKKQLFITASGESLMSIPGELQ